MAKTHPHTDSPSRADLERIAAGKPLVGLYVALHEVVLDVLPDVRSSVDEVDAAIGYGARQYGYGGWGMGAVTPFSKWVSLTLMKGSLLDDPENLLTGTAVMRHVKLGSLDELEAKRDGIAALLVAASRLHDD